MKRTVLQAVTAAGGTDRSRSLLWLPVLGVIAWVILPLVSGRETLFLRDVMTLHYPVKLSQVEAMRSGVLPLVDAYRAGGQPLLGNPNSVALHPDNLLYLVAPSLWALNAHFWMHWLLAPLAMFWLARELGLRRDSSWAAATLWGLGGFLLSNMNFYNLIAGVALAPALVAACLRALSEERRVAKQGLLAVAALCCLQAVSGDPMISVQVVLMSGLAVASRILARELRFAESWRSVLGVVLAAGAGLLIAWPQISEFLRILSVSFRSSFGYEGDLGLQGSWDPRMLLEWLLPFAYGQPNLSFWGDEIYGSLAIYYSTHPGVLGILLVLVSGVRRTSVRIWAWLLVLLGLFMSLGQFNPLVAWLADAPGARLLRFPIKFWLLVAVGGSVLGGLGWERLFGDSSEVSRDVERTQTLFTRWGGLLILFYVAMAAGLVQFPELFRATVGEVMADEFLVDRPEEVRLRWLALSVVLALVTTFLIGSLRFLKEKRACGFIVLAAHAVAQMLFMSALVPTDSPANYTKKPALLEHVEPGETVVQLGAYGNFSGRTVPSSYPDRRPYWTARQGYEELRSFGGAGFGQRYELNVSAEGLDSYLTEATLWALRPMTDAQRIQVLRSLGADVLILDRPLELGGLPEDGAGVEIRHRVPSYGRDLTFYKIQESPPDVYLTGDIRVAADLPEALDLVSDPRFDARRSAVITGSIEPLAVAPGELEVMSSEPTFLRVRTSAEHPNLLMWQRSHLPLYRATIDGLSAPLEVVNVSRMGIRVPPGEHVIEVSLDTSPFWRSLLAWPMALVLLMWLLLRWLPGQDGSSPALLRRAPRRESAKP